MKLTIYADITTGEVIVTAPINGSDRQAIFSSLTSPELPTIGPRWHFGLKIGDQELFLAENDFAALVRHIDEIEADERSALQ